MVAAAAIPLTAKALAYAKGLLGLKTAGMAAAGAAARGVAARGVMGKGARAAGSRLMEAAGTNTTERLMTFAPDVVFGGMTALNTPGDLGDKLIAGGSDMILGGLGGVGLTGAIGPKRLGQYRAFVDFAGSTAGGYGGMAVGDQLMRAKDSMMGGAGQTPYERLAEEDRRALEQNLLAQYGIGGYNLNQYDPFLASNGLG
jgi:hypothetical protein